MKFTIAKLSRAHCHKQIDDAPDGYIMSITAPTRSTLQNDKMWSLLSEVSAQVDWHGNKLSKEEWKDVFSASLNRQKVVPGLDGGFVVIGARTSKMSVKEMSDMIELIYAFGSANGVNFVI